MGSATALINVESMEMSMDMAQTAMTRLSYLGSQKENPPEVQSVVVGCIAVLLRMLDDQLNIAPEAAVRLAIEILMAAGYEWDEDLIGEVEKSHVPPKEDS